MYTSGYYGTVEYCISPVNVRYVVLLYSTTCVAVVPRFTALGGSFRGFGALLGKKYSDQTKVPQRRHFEIILLFTTFDEEKCPPRMSGDTCKAVTMRVESRVCPDEPGNQAP